MDVREPAEAAEAPVPGLLAPHCVHVPLAAVLDGSHGLDPHAAGPVVLLCRTGARATQAAEHLRAKGFAAAAVLQGGLDAWRH